MPVREPGTDRIIAVGRVLPAAHRDRPRGQRTRVWVPGLVVAIAVSALVPVALRHRPAGRDTITRQRRALESPGHAADPAQSPERGAQRTRAAGGRAQHDAVNERSLRRISSDLHDGPGQMLSLALMRLGAMRRRQATGAVADDRTSCAEVESAAAGRAARHARDRGRPAPAGARTDDAPGRWSSVPSTTTFARSGTPVELAFDPASMPAAGRRPAGQDHALPCAAGAAVERDPPRERRRTSPCASA